MNWVFVLGLVTGLRSMTGMAVVCWAAWLVWLPERGWAAWTAHLVTMLIFAGLAAAEYVGDTLPKTPSRKAPGPAAARLVLGGLVGALAAWAIREPVAGGILTGVVGAAIGTWGGYTVRMWAAKLAGRDLPVGLTESAVALGLAVLAVWELHQGIAWDLRRGAF